ncbi:hypothetical protein XENTR_v10010599 [Xenopus tropicalis]|uniref:Transcription factor E2F8 n=1 Tax=Xenopus tropicalis TaxID=8364 RepID=A0A1B8Y1F7_XENTR|nr:transcription factor E2F8 [Xenopus tropicalis]XP_004913394.1 transcription factor E2F8 [Xenopus tropicalis]KAE8606108.1 hypothetical protein XENTR_v10010599 [Xenopus tropicalis]KAE8606109.1 hypothetical protein XENTR_v10010599 [Xenopus tropicalis]KAE8606110.1 hypothetical protein XENTR_v10010599 [Xenopus tropicalis]|eukprot:XP_017945607.1 PREDICTED: transcription factor E2F8 [Xenopus tropicalis]
MEEGSKENCGFNGSPMGSRSPPKQLTSAASVLGEIQIAAANLKTPTKPQERNNADPWTPTANLKMLISAASPEIRNREREILEEQFSGDELEKTLPSRKEKSLGLLCHKFLARYPSYPNPAVNNSICLDEVAGELSVERRRIYDIVNVLESLHMVSRLAKNKYIWHGRLNLSKTFDALKKVGEENRYGEQIQLLRKREQEECDSQNSPNAETQKPLAKQPEVGFVELPGLEFRAASVNSRKEKSLRVMSQRFVMLFLVSDPQIVSLEVAAKILIGEDQLEDLDKSKFKTKIRRLYDIANVLTSLNLIKKVHVTEEKGRKPAFQWTCPELCTDDQENRSSPAALTPVAIDLSSPKENCAKNLFASGGKTFTRHPSLIKLAKSIENDRRKINSAPSSPIKSGDGSSSAASKMAQLAAICKQQLQQSRDQTKVKLKVSACKAKSTVKQPGGSDKNQTPTYCRAIPLLHPHPSAAPPYTVIVQPPQEQTLSRQSPPALAHSVPLAQGYTNRTPPEAPLQGGRHEGDGTSHSEDHSAQERHPKRLPESDRGCTSKRMKSSAVDDVTETLYPSGYLIPIHLAPVAPEPSKENTGPSSENKLFTSPIPGVFPLKLMFSPGPVTAVPVMSRGGQHVGGGSGSASRSPSPGMFTFALQNRELISAGLPQGATVSPRNGRGQEELSAASVLNCKHVSPVPYHGQPFTVFALQQSAVPVTPKGYHSLQETFFRTPGGMGCSPPESARKLDVGTDD